MLSEVQVCVIANVLASLWLLVAFAVYADKYDIKSPNLVGSVGGGFALIVLGTCLCFHSTFPL